MFRSEEAMKAYFWGNPNLTILSLEDRERACVFVPDCLWFLPAASEETIMNNEVSMRAFRGDPSVKEFYLARVQGHVAADEAWQRIGWKNGKGGIVGCTIHGDNYGQYETELGIPESLTRLAEQIFEGLSSEKSKKWAEQFLNAIPVGADLKRVWQQFAFWLLGDPRDGVIRHVQTEEQRQVITRIAQLYREQCQDLGAWENVRSSAMRIVGKAAYSATQENSQNNNGAYHAVHASYYASLVGGSATSVFAFAVHHASFAAEAVEAGAQTCGDCEVEEVETLREGFYGKQAEKLLELLKAAA